MNCDLHQALPGTQSFISPFAWFATCMSSMEQDQQAVPGCMYLSSLVGYNLRTLRHQQFVL